MMGAEVGFDGFRVTTKIEGAHPLHTDYPLLPGDLLVRDFDGTYAKEAPGLAVIGFVLSDADVAAMEPVKFTRAGLSYSLTPPAGPREQGGERCACPAAEVESGACVLCGKPFPVGGGV